MVLMFSNDELTKLNQMFANLYEKDDYQQAFTVFLEELKEMVRFQKGDVYFYKTEGDHINFEEFFFVDWGEGDLQKYLNNYADMDDALPIVSLKQPVMFRSSDVFMSDERMKTKYYNELLLPAGMEHSIEGNIYHGDDGYAAGIGIHRPDSIGAFSQKELEIMKLSRPHLVNIARKFVEEKSAVDPYLVGLASIYNATDIGICVLDGSMNVVDSNLARGALLNPEYMGEMLRSLVTIAKGLKEKIQKKGISENYSENKVHSNITVGHDKFYTEVACVKDTGTDYKFVATIYSLNAMLSNMTKDIKDRFSLTDREYEIVQCALKGMNNIEIGREMFISLPTVKKHLTNVYNKMNIEGKHQLLDVLLR